MKKRILITGASGFIAGRLRSFVEEKKLPFEVGGISHRWEDPQIKVFRCDFTDPKKLREILSSFRPDYIFHLAGGRLPDEKEMLFANFETTRVLFDALQGVENFHPRIIIPSTAAEYGRLAKTVKFVREESPLHPVSWYGFVKYMQTSLSLMYARRGFDVVVARMFNILGSGVPESLAVGRFAKEIVKIEQGRHPAILETRNLSGKRDFLDVEDICSGLISIALHGKKGESYNLCSGRAYGIRPLLKKLLKYSVVKQIEIKEEKENFSHSYDCIGSNAKIKKTLSWKPQISIDESLQKSLNYYRGLKTF